MNLDACMVKPSKAAPQGNAMKTLAIAIIVAFVLLGDAFFHTTADGLLGAICNYLWKARMHGLPDLTTLLRMFKNTRLDSCTTRFSTTSSHPDPPSFIYLYVLLLCCCHKNNNNRIEKLSSITTHTHTHTHTQLTKDSFHYGCMLFSQSKNYLPAGR